VSEKLPIESALPEVMAALSTHSAALLIAPPGAGKTTRVPLALLDAPWRKDGIILVLEPRRIAARGAALRMAALLGEPLGQRVGLITRFDQQSSGKTRILVVTEGVFTRMVVDDPSLGGIAAILFDEFHERSLDADIGLAFALEAQGALRDGLKLLIMSATLDDARISTVLRDAPVIRSEGRAFPVETRYRGRAPDARIEDEMARAILAAIRAEDGSLLAFLPGQGEIERVARLLEPNLPQDFILAPLYGGLDGAAQDQAIAPAPPGKRKIVLATSIAETSITIEGVRIVVDSGLARVPRYAPDLGLSRLETIRVSRASADQRRGRAGRTAPGIAIRLWDEAQDQGLIAFNRPEILESDLAGFRLDCAAWGILDPKSLPLIDAPPDVALKEAETLLHDLGALDEAGRITPRGKLLRAVPLAPRLAALVLEGARFGMAEEAALIGALISERGVGGASVDLAQRVERALQERGPRASKLRAMAKGWAALATRAVREVKDASLSTGALLVLAFPDRVGKSRGDGAFSLANGRIAALEPSEALATAPFIVAADLTGSAARARITLGARIEKAEIEALFAPLITTEDETRFDATAGALRRRRIRRFKALMLESTTLPILPDDAAASALAEGAAMLGIDRLPWSKAQQQLRHRIAFLRAKDESWPDLSAEALAKTVEDWLAPHLLGKTALAMIDAETLGAALDALVPYALRARLAQEAPTHFIAPTGNSHVIDYEAAQAPLVSLRVQELFGLKTHPAIAGGSLPLTLELLSPAHRPIQITRDLPGFWAGSWADVRADLRGRYPRHPWPEDPAHATPTARAKPRNT